ncbi:hypothetical protein R6Q59_017145 [Mikania micrantha]
MASMLKANLPSTNVSLRGQMYFTISHELNWLALKGVDHFIVNAINSPFVGMKFGTKHIDILC